MLKKRILGFLHLFFQKITGFFLETTNLLKEAFLNQGKVVQKTLTFQDRCNNSGFDDAKPVWVLSTGRAGTASLDNLFKFFPEIQSYHEPKPNLFKFSFDYYSQKISSVEALNSLTYLRDEFVHEAMYKNRLYVETNNRCSYIANLLLKRYPNSRFIHLYRDPYDYIISGLRRKWYSGHNCDFTRIKPLRGEVYYEKWAQMSDMEKIAWNWLKVNEIILKFLETLPPDQRLSVKAEELFRGDESLIKKILKFIGLKPPYPIYKIQKSLKKKVNAQKTGKMIKRNDCTKEDLASVNEIIEPIAKQLNYQLS